MNSEFVTFRDSGECFDDYPSMYNGLNMKRKIYMNNEHSHENGNDSHFVSA